MKKSLMVLFLGLAVSAPTMAMEKQPAPAQEAKTPDASVKLVTGARPGFKDHQAAILQVLEREEKSIAVLKRCVAQAKADAAMEQCLLDHVKNLQPGGMQ